MLDTPQSTGVKGSQDSSCPYGTHRATEETPHLPYTHTHRGPCEMAIVLTGHHEDVVPRLGGLGRLNELRFKRGWDEPGKRGGRRPEASPLGVHLRVDSAQRL